MKLPMAKKGRDAPFLYCQRHDQDQVQPTGLYFAATEVLQFH